MVVLEAVLARQGRQVSDQDVVARSAAVVAKVEGLGGQVLLKAAPEQRGGTVAIIADPTGAEVAIQKWPIEEAGDDD